MKPEICLEHPEKNLYIICPKRTTREKSALSRIIRIIVEIVDPDSIILFGSRATGNEEKESEYDICVLKPEIEGEKTAT